MIPTFIFLMLAHTIADFGLQTRWQANNKNSNWKALTHHVAIYTTVVTAVFVALFFYQGFRSWEWVWFAPITFAAHFATDAITSRRSKYHTTKASELRRLAVSTASDVTDADRKVAETRANAQEKWFWTTIGIDQWLHFVQLFVTANYIVLYAGISVALNSL